MNYSKFDLFSPLLTPQTPTMSRMNRMSLTYGEAVQYGMENVSWMRRHSGWGK